MRSIAASPWTIRSPSTCLVAEFPSLSWLAPTAEQARAGIERMVRRSVQERVHNTIPLSELVAELGIADEVEC